MLKLSTATLISGLLVACAADDSAPTPDGTDASVADSGARDASGDDASTSPDAQAQAEGGTIGNDENVVGTAKEADCDLNGVWIARQSTEAEALLAKQIANNWYYLELTQNGEEVEVTAHKDCGIQVYGSVTVQLTPATTRALMAHNSQVGRKGKVVKQADGTCSFEMETFWSVRGVTESQYLPTPRTRDVTVAQLKSELPLPAKGSSGIEDWDGDGQPGTAWQISGIAQGQRHSAQRDRTTWFSAPGYTIAGSNSFSDLLVRASFDVEELVYEAKAPDGSEAPTLRVVATPNANAAHSLALRLLGRDRAAAKASGVIKSDDFDTCLAVQAALPALKMLK